jgi:hypothetical protein
MSLDSLVDEEDAEVPGDLEDNVVDEVVDESDLGVEEDDMGNYTIEVQLDYDTAAL